MPKKNMGLKRKNLTGYMGGGVFKSKAPVSSSFRGGGATEVGTEKKVQSYKEYAKKMFGGGISQPSRQAPPLTGGAVLPDRPTRGVKIPRVVGTAPLTGGPEFQPTKADDRGYATGDSTSEMNKKKGSDWRARRKSKGRGVITVKPPGKPKIKKIIKTPAFKPTKADDRGMYVGGTVPPIDPRKSQQAVEAAKKRNAALKRKRAAVKRVKRTSTQAERKATRSPGGFAGGGTLASMRKNIIGIKKDRGLTAKSGARKGMTKKRVTRRGGG